MNSLSAVSIAVSSLALGIAVMAAWRASRTRMNRALLEMQRRTEEFAATLEMLAVEVKRARMREHARQMTKDRVAKRAAAAETEEPDAYRDPERWKSWAAKHLTHNNRRTPTDDQ